MPGLSTHFADRLAEAMDRAGSPACVGLDPVLEKIPAEVRARHAEPVQTVREFCEGVLDAVAGVVGIVKPQSACFERFGPAGVEVLRQVVLAAKARGLIVILDAKRGDIGTTAEHYAEAVFTDAWGGADAVTLSGYMGPDTIDPFLKRAGNERGVFVLVRTSNPGSDFVQTQRLADGRSVADLIADMVATLGKGHMGTRGMSAVGAVVGATKSSEAAALRARMPQQFFLVPGYGTQGGTLDDVRVMTKPGSGRAGDLGVIVNASRSVLYPAPTPGATWTDSVRSAAEKLRDELATLANR